MAQSKFQTLMQRAALLQPITVAIVCPESTVALAGAILAVERNYIIPVLIGDATTIQKNAAELGKDISTYRIIDVSDHEAINTTIQLAKNGEIQAIMKGSLHTDELMGALVNKENGLRTGRRMSHCMVVDIPAYKKLLILTDVALNINPDLKSKKDIVQNAIDLATALGINSPKVALLSAVEAVNPNIPSTLDYAEICKMAAAGEITGATIEGPLSFDLAVSEESVKIKKIKSNVAGDADILVVPNLESGNILFKALDCFAKVDSWGIIVGAKISVILTSRSAAIESRAGSCLLAKLLIQSK